MDKICDIGTEYAIKVELNNAINAKVIGKADTGIAKPIGGFMGRAIKLIMVIVDVLIIIAAVVNTIKLFFRRKYFNLCISIIPMKEL